MPRLSVYSYGFRVGSKKHFPIHRRCLYCGCITFLNRYNPGPFCYIHKIKGEVKSFLLVRSKRGARIKKKSFPAEEI